MRTKLLKITFGVLLGPALVTGCGYTPPPSTDTAAPAYKTDYAACDASVPDAVNKRNAKTGHAWFASPITRWSMLDNGMNECMAGKGWGQLRACTADELKAGNRNGPLVVTARNGQCRDPSVRKG